nr:HAMP domain-containing sensor histidine kinase [uncultured Carboxylicivirga sp.]
MKSKNEKIGYTVDKENETLFQLKSRHEQSEKRLIAQNKRLIAIIGHDIKSPVSAIISFLGFLKDGVSEWDRKVVEEYIDVVLTSAESTLNLLESILFWALAEDFNDSYEPNNIDFNNILADETKNLELFASVKNINISLPVSSEIKIYADKNMVKSVFRNLLSNAIKYSHMNGRIDISVLYKNGFVETTIKDYGVGITSEVSDTLLNSNNKISTMGTNNESGTALGLSLCKEFIDIHKGKIWIVSIPGKGSEFKFTLPLSTH